MEYKKGDRVIIGGDREKYKYKIDNDSYDTIWNGKRTSKWIEKKMTIKYIFYSIIFGGYLFRIEEEESLLFPASDIIKYKNYFKDILEDLKIK